MSAKFWPLFAAWFAIVLSPLSAAEPARDQLVTEQWSALIGSELDGVWREPSGKWFVAADAQQAEGNPQRLAPIPGSGVIINGDDGRTENLLSQVEHGDAEVHIEFMVPEGSNSGVYVQGRYEIQVLDSWGVEQPESSDCGGIYQRWADGRGFDGHPPRVNASRAPGQWQAFDVIFRAPRFDEQGNKVANARFVRVVHNGQVVHEDVELTGPTRSASFEDEQPWGPIMLQGDHGPVAYRNLRIRSIPADAATE